MSKEILKDIMDNIISIPSWKVCALKHNSKKRQIEYSCCDIQLSKNDIQDIIQDYHDTFFKKYADDQWKVEQYTGFDPDHVIRTISTEHDLIKSSWTLLKESIQRSVDSASLLDFEANAYLLIGKYNDQYIYLITNRKLQYNYTNKKHYSFRNNELIRMKEPLFSFSKSFDILVWNRNAYFFGISGETLLDLERSYKRICHKHLEEIEQANIIQDMELFRKVASFGHYPRQFLTFNSQVFAKLQTSEGKMITNQCNIQFDEETGKFILNDQADAERFLKIICDKAKRELFENGFCEVPKSKPLE